MQNYLNVISNSKAASHLNFQSQKWEDEVCEPSASSFTYVYIQSWILRKAFISIGEVLRYFSIMATETSKRYLSLIIDYLINHYFCFTDFKCKWVASLPLRLTKDDNGTWKHIMVVSLAYGGYTLRHFTDNKNYR